MGLPTAGRTDQEDVGLLHDHIPKVGIGDDGIGSVSIPGIDETLEMVRHAEGEPPLGDVLPDHELVEVGDQGLGRRDRGEEGFL